MACQGSSYSPHLIEGEVSLRVIESVTYDNLSLQSQKPIFGLFIITNFRVLFVSQPCFVAHQMKGIDPDYDDSCNCNLPICVIDKIKRKKNEIIFECKDIRLVKFSFGTMNDADSAFMGVEQFLAVKQTNRFCFVNKELEGLNFSHLLSLSLFSSLLFSSLFFIHSFQLEIISRNFFRA